MSCTYKERMFNLPATQQANGPMPASSPVASASSSSSSSSSSQPQLTNGGPSQIRLPPKKDFRSESEQQQLQQIQKVSPFPTSGTQSQAIRNADSPLDLSVKTRKRSADTTIFDYFLGGMSPLKRTKAATTGVPPIPLDLTKTKTSPMKQMVPPPGMMSPTYTTTNPYAYKTMTPKASSSSSASPSKLKHVKPSKGKEVHNTIRSLPPDSVSRITVGQQQQTTSNRQKLPGGYISFPSMFTPQPTSVGAAGLSPSSLMAKSQTGHGGDSRVSGSHQQISHGLREVSAESVKSSSQRGLTLFEQQQHGQSTSRSHHIQQYQYSQQRQLHPNQQQHYQPTRQMHATANQRPPHTSQRPPPIQQQSASSQRPQPPPPPPPHCQPNPRLRDHDLVTQQHRLQQQQRLQQHFLQQQQQRQQQSPIHPASSSSSLTSPITISSPSSPSVTVLSSTSSSSSTSLAASVSSSSSSTSASSTRLLPLSVSSAYSEISATSGAGGVSAKVFPFHQMEQSSKKYDSLPSTHKLRPNGNVGMVSDGIASNNSSIEMTSGGMSRYSPDSTDCTISGVTRRVPMVSDLHSQQRHLHQTYQDQQELSALYAGIPLDKLANSANGKTPSGYKTMPMSPYHQQQMYVPAAFQKLSQADSQKKHSQIVSNNISGSAKSASILSESPSSKAYHSAYHYQQQQRHILMTANKYEGATVVAATAPAVSGPHHITSPPSSYSSSVPPTTSSSSSSSSSTSSSAMVSVQSNQKMKQPPQTLHYNNLSMKSPSRSSLELLRISNDSNDDVKIIGSTPGPGSSASSSNTPSRPMKEVPVINIISDSQESPSPGRGPAKSLVASGNGPTISGRGAHATSSQQGSETAKIFTTPLSINIPNESSTESSASGTTTGGAGKSEAASGKSSLTESRDPKLGSRKHIIMNAVNHDEALKKVFHVDNGSGTSLNPHEESLSETSFNSISPAPSPKMPILSPQHKNPPRMGSPSTSDPPPLEPSPATFLENPSPVSFVQENLSNNDQIVRPNLEIKRAPTNAAPQRPKPPIAYLQDPMFRAQFPSSVFGQHTPYLSAFNAPMHPYMHLMPTAEHTVHATASAAAAATRIPEGNGNTGSGVPPAGMAGANGGKVVMDSLREKREGFNVRSTVRNKNIPVANVAPIVQGKHYRQSTSTNSGRGNTNNVNNNVGPNLGLPLNATSSNGEINHSNNSDEVKIISASNDGPYRSSGVGEKGKSKSGSIVTGAGGGGDSSAGGGGGLKEASGKVSPTMPRTFFSPHNIISMFKNSKNEKILESMCCDKNAQRGKMSLKDAINTLLEKHCKELHVETDQGEGSPSCLSSSSRSSDVEIIENPFERDDDPLITETTSSTTTLNNTTTTTTTTTTNSNNLSANSNRHPLLHRHSGTTTNTTTTITTTITNTTTFGTIVSSAINDATLADNNRPTIPSNERLPGAFTSKKEQNRQLLLQPQDHDDEDVITLTVESNPQFNTNTNSNNNSAETNSKNRLGNLQTDAHMNRLKQKLLQSVPVDMSNSEVPSTGYKKYNCKSGDVSGVNSTSGKSRTGCNHVSDKHHLKESGKAEEAALVNLCQSAVTNTRERIPDKYPGADGQRLGSQRAQHCQEKKSFTSDIHKVVKNQDRTEQNLEDVFNRTKGKDKYLSEKRKTSGRRLAEELKRKAVLRAVVYRKTLYQEFNERIRIGRTHKDGDNRIIMTRSSTRDRGSQRTRRRSSLRPRAARPQRGALVEKDSEEDESLPGCWEIERSSPSLRLRRRRGGAIAANNSNSISNINDSTSGSGSINNNNNNNNNNNTTTNTNKRRLMMTLHWRPRRASKNFCVAGRRKYRVVTRYSSRSKRNMFGSQLPHSYNRQTLDWAEVRQLPVPARKNPPGSSTRTTTVDMEELRDDETESVASNSNSISGTLPIPPEIRRIAINKNSGETLLHRSARCGYEDVLLHCLETKSVDVNARDNAGFTPLHECCVRGNLVIARYLISYGADVNQCSQDGIRPIHDAVENDHIEMVRLLLSFGADPLLTTYSGKSPMKIARSGRMINLLKDHISDMNGDDSHEVTPWEFHGSWNIQEVDASSGNPIFDDAPSDSETNESDTEDFVFDDCPLSTFSLQSNIDKKYFTVLDIAHNTGEKLDKIRELCQPNIFTMKFDKFVNETKSLACLQATMSRTMAQKSDFVELIDAEEYNNVMAALSGRPCNDPKKTLPLNQPSTSTNSKMGANSSKGKDQISDKAFNGQERPLDKDIPLSPLSMSDDEASHLDVANSSYFQVSPDLSTYSAKENTTISTRTANVTTTLATKIEPVSTAEKSHPTKISDDSDNYQESGAETSVPTLSFKDKFVSGQTRTTKKKRVAMDSVFPASKSATATVAGAATSVRHNGHFTIKMGNLPDDYYQAFGIDQTGGVSDHSGKSPRKISKDPPHSYTENLDCSKKDQIPTDSSVVIDR